MSAGRRGFTAIGQWVASVDLDVLADLGLAGRPDESTFRRLFAALDADLLDRLLGVWAATRNGVVDGRRVIAIDGKTVCCAPGLVEAVVCPGFSGRSDGGR